MLPFGVTIPATVPQRSEIPEGLMNYPLCWPPERKSPTSNTTKFFTTKSIWPHGIHVWGCARFSNLQSVHQFQCKTLTAFVSSPRYVNNQNIHPDLRTTFIKNEVRSQKTCHIISQASPQHSSDSIAWFMNWSTAHRRLKRPWTSHLLIPTAGK
jgi:hypothetical protein